MRTTSTIVLLICLLVCDLSLVFTKSANSPSTNKRLKAVASNTVEKWIKAGTEEEARQYLEDLENDYSVNCNAQMTARWKYITNVTDETAQKSVEALNVFLKYQATVQTHISENFEWDMFLDEKIKRQLTYLSIRGPGNMPAEDVAEMNKILNEMETSYATASVCEYENEDKCDLKLGDIAKLLTTATDYDELTHYWTAWHDVIGKAVSPQKYKTFIDYQNQMAKANGFEDMSQMWLEPYNDGVDRPEGFYNYFKNYMKQLWTEIQPQFNKLQAYVRMKLRENPDYENKIRKFGYLPANILGNVWAQDWISLDNATRPYLNISSLDATEAMLKKGYNVSKMFQVSDDFFAGLGLDRMTQIFWKESDLIAPEPGREKVCHASAEDFCQGVGGEDFRINMCTTVTMGDLVTVHHEMGHIEYFMQYTNQPYIFREGANPGFHEAIGDALALAVTTPKHLQCELELELGLDIDCDVRTNKDETTKNEQVLRDINFLYLMALQKFPLFPFAISMDSWRWEVFENKTSEDQYNKRWWEIRQKNQGIKPPINRPSDSFDPAAKYHIVANVPYIRYFISHILQFEFYQAMCIEAGEYNSTDPGSKPLHQCDFSKSIEAGQKLKDLMQLGFSEPWPDALEKITGNRVMSTEPLVAYFKPLFDFIDEELRKSDEKICYGATCNDFAQEYLNTNYEPAVILATTKAVHAEWEYVTDLTNEDKENATVIANTELANYQFKEWNETIRHYEYDYVLENSGDRNETLTQRQLKFLNAVGTAALPEAELAQYNAILSQMSKAYGTAKICPYDKKDNCDLATEGLTLEPHIEAILANSNDYDELAYAWEAWRDASGRQIREQYNTYIDLSNHAAVLNGYNDMSEFWILRYESDTFKSDMEALWKTVQPLYLEFHGYVRYKLQQKFADKIKDDDPIPAHLLGNMWAQTWDNIYPDVIPFKDAPIFDVTDKLKEKYPDTEAGVRGMFVVADEFFTSLGLTPMTMSYGEKAMIVKPQGREVVCHASAWDFYDKEDFRVKMCTNVNQEDFVTIHHELGHIQYFLNYKELPSSLRDGANPGFHEAIGDVIALSVETPQHMVKLGLMDPTPPSDESTINYLMKMALQKVAFLPFGFLIDSYRWKVFDGTIPRENLTYNWLKMRSEFQGVVPPVLRSEQDFDAGAKYHVPGNTPYIRYFVSFILQFQIHRSLCIVAGEYIPGNPDKPLHDCDIYENVAAGNILKNVLESGLSQNWRELLQSSIGQDNLDSTPITEYFEPLKNYLTQYRISEGYKIEWRANAFEEFFDSQVDSSTTEIFSQANQEPSTPAPTRETQKPSTQTSGPVSTNTPEERETPTAAIIVGIILGVAVIIIVAGYFVMKKFKK